MPTFQAKRKKTPEITHSPNQPESNEPTGDPGISMSNLLSDSVSSLHKAVELNRHENNVLELIIQASKTMPGDLLSEDIRKATTYGIVRHQIASINQPIPNAEKKALMKYFGDDKHPTGVANLEDRFQKSNTASKICNKNYIPGPSSVLLDTVTNATTAVPLDAMVEWEEARKQFVKKVEGAYTRHVGNKPTKAELETIIMGLHIQAKQNDKEVFGNYLEG